MIIEVFQKYNRRKHEERDVVFSDEKNSNSEEKIKRSLLKTLSWRLVGTLDTILISYIITGEIAMALSIGSIEVISKMALYFLHERTWNTIKWGK